MYGKSEIIAMLRDSGTAFDVVEHEAVFTMEGMDRLGLPFAQDVVKNLFVRDDKKRSYYLVVMPEDKPCNMKALRRSLGSRPLRFASEEDLASILGLIPGAVTPFGLLNDADRKTTLVVDAALSERERVGIHPNDNTATVHVPLDDVLGIVKAHGNPVVVVDLEDASVDSAGS